MAGVRPDPFDQIASRFNKRAPRLPTLAHYLAMLASGWVIIAVCVGVGMAATVAYARQIPPVWEASASIELPDLPTYIDITSKGRPAQRVTIDTTGQLVFSEPVLRAVKRVTGDKLDDIDDRISVSAYPLSRVIIITLKDRDRDDAIAGADAAAEELVTQRGKVLAGTRRGPARDLINQLRDLNADGVERYGFSPVTVRIQQHIADINDNLQRYSNTKSRVVNRAAPGKRVAAHSEVYITTGAVVGFMLGVVWVWWRPRQRDAFDHLPGRPISEV